MLKKIYEEKSCRTVSSKIGDGNTQIQTIVKERVDIIYYENGKVVNDQTRSTESLEWQVTMN